MSSATLLLLLLHHTALVCTSVHQTVGLSGAVVAVSCQVSSAKCGDYHSIKWYKEGARVAVYSPATKWWRVEGHLHDRAQVKVDEENTKLTFTLSAGEEGQYKCEVSFLSIFLHCPVVQVTSLVVRAMPESVMSCPC